MTETVLSPVTRMRAFLRSILARVHALYQAAIWRARAVRDAIIRFLGG